MSDQQVKEVTWEMATVAPPNGLRQSIKGLAPEELLAMLFENNGGVQIGGDPASKGGDSTANPNITVEQLNQMQNEDRALREAMLRVGEEVSRDLAAETQRLADANTAEVYRDREVRRTLQRLSKDELIGLITGVIQEAYQSQDDYGALPILELRLAGRIRMPAYVPLSYRYSLNTPPGWCTPSRNGITGGFRQAHCDCPSCRAARERQGSWGNYRRGEDADYINIDEASFLSTAEVAEAMRNIDRQPETVRFRSENVT